MSRLIARVVCAFVLSSTLMPTASPSAAVEPGLPYIPNPSGFVIRRGTNLSHWLSQDFGWAPRLTWTTENDIRYIARLGFDHVRLPVDEKELWSDDGRPNEEAFALMLKCIGWAQANNLRVIVDLHTIRSHHFNAANEGMAPNTLWTDAKAKEVFFKLWRELSQRLRHLPVDHVAYEIMNEPVADDHEDWNRLVAAAMKEIRTNEPGRVVVIGSNRWQIPSTLPFLKVPAGDRNIILSTHTYSPLIFTHYLADWTPLRVYKGEVRYPGLPVAREVLEGFLASGDRAMLDLVANARDEWNRDRIFRELEPAIRRAKELRLQLYCGEFGCLPTPPRADRLAYYRDIVAVFEANGMAWANWEYKGDFGLFEWHGSTRAAGAPDEELIDALLGRR
jgi:endoglucanase